MGSLWSLLVGGEGFPRSCPRDLLLASREHSGLHSPSTGTASSGLSLLESPAAPACSRLRGCRACRRSTAVLSLDRIRMRVTDNPSQLQLLMPTQCDTSGGDTCPVAHRALCISLSFFFMMLSLLPPSKSAWCVGFAMPEQGLPPRVPGTIEAPGAAQLSSVVSFLVMFFFPE